MTALGSWYGQDDTPCLVLVATRHFGTEEALPCVVPINNAWKWAEETGDPRYAVDNSMVFGRALGLNVADIRTPMKITSIIRDCLGDLLAMPVRPKDDKIVVADATVTNRETGAKRYAEIVENV